MSSAPPPPLPVPLAPGFLPAGSPHAAAFQEALEEGRVLLFPAPGFALDAGEKRFLTDSWLGARTKNVSLSPGSERLSGTGARGAERDALARLLTRYRRQAAALVSALLPRYVSSLRIARTSFRPVEASGRRTSLRRDDRLLHVDAFPASPTGGDRILRLFTNLHPGVERVWRVGEPFEAAARRFAPRLRLPLPGTASLLRGLGVTHGRRAPYDALMLQLHDRMKEDGEYQLRSPQRTVGFPPGSSWLAFTDQLLHAAVSGQFMLEQTFHVPVRALARTGAAPLRILESLLGRRLAPEPAGFAGGGPATGEPG